MEIKTMSQIKSTPENVWRILTDPAAFSAWSGRQAIAADIRPGGSIRFATPGTEPETETVITAYEEGKLLSLSGPMADETYRIYPNTAGCLLEKSVVTKNDEGSGEAEYAQRAAGEQMILDSLRRFAEKNGRPEKKSHKKWVIPVVILAVLAALGVAGWFLLLNPYLKEQERIRKYNSGAEAIEDGRYKEAKEIFEELGDYDDAPDLLEYAEKGIDYEKAKKKMDKGEYAEARELLAPLGNFKDTADLIRECDNRLAYEEAQELIDSGEYRRAREILTGLRDFENSAELIRECDRVIAFEDANNLAAEGKYSEALEKLEEAGDYPGASDLAQYCRKELNDQKIRDLVASEQYEEALELLESDDAADMQDRDQLISECENGISYKEALSLFGEEKYFSASKEFKKLGSFKDSQDYASKCVQTKPSTGETYHNSAYSGRSVSLKIQPPSDGTCTYFKIYAQSGGSEVLVLSAFINKNSNVKVYLPAGSYIFKAASGSGDWYGEKEMFGSKGTYSRLTSSSTSDIFTLKSNNDYTLTLRTETGNGNVGSQTENMNSF